MSSRERSRFLLVISVLLILLILSLAVASTYAKPDKDVQRSVASLEFIGEVNIPTGTQFGGTEVGSLSAITRDANRGVYYILSNDRSQINPAHYYPADIDVSDGWLDPGDILFQDVTFLQDRSRSTFPPLSIDLEGIFLTRPGQL